MPSAPSATPAQAGSRPDLASLQQAAEWFAALSSENATDADRKQWQAWHASSAAHQAAWQRVEAVSGKFASVPTHGHAAAYTLLEPRSTSRRASLKALAVLWAAGLGGWVAWRTEPWHSVLASHHTGTGEQRQFALDDNSTLWLNTATSVSVDYSPTLRRIRVREGEILVQTHADSAVPARAFVVDTRHGRMQALGTRFAVRQGGEHTDLTVFEGAVQVHPANASQAARTIQRGEQARFDAHGIHAVEAANPARQSWHNGLLLAEDMRLTDFLAELARYRHGQIVCHPAVANVRVVGTYRTADTDAVLALLQAALPIRIRHTLPWRVDVLPV